MTTNNSSNYSPVQHNIQVGGASGTLNNVPPSATVGIPLISQGSSAQPLFGTAGIAGGGTNATSMSTTNGIIKYDGTRLVTSTSAVIDSSNRMTNSSQPAFSVYLNTGVNGVTGGNSGNVYQVIFDTVVHNNGGYSTSTGVFTAPVTGFYQFNVVVSLNSVSTSNTNGELDLIVSGKAVRLWTLLPQNISIGGFMSMQGSTMWYMSANDTAHVQIVLTGNGSTNNVGVAGFQNGFLTTTFSGFLVVA